MTAAQRPGPAGRTVQPIAGFRQDEAGDWIADLACSHSQHMRHEPPFHDRPWVLTAAGRQARLGTEVACPPCDWAAAAT